MNESAALLQMERQMQATSTNKKQLVVNKNRILNVEQGFYAAADEMRPPNISTNFYAGSDEMRPPIVASGFYAASDEMRPPIVCH